MSSTPRWANPLPAWSSCSSVSIPRRSSSRDERRTPTVASATRGTYRITFDTAGYFAATGRASFYPSVTVLFEVAEPTQHHHVPLLLSPFGYSTYRGS
jgi:5-hydroxyisourate hydrolase